VDTPADNTIIVNQVYDSNWKIVEGKGEVISAGGMIGVRLPPGRQQVRLAYRSPAFMLGAIVTFFTCIGAIVLWRKQTLFGWDV
jgi:uncharacterized membrane protein YfhO